MTEGTAPTGARGSRRGSPRQYRHSLLIDPNGPIVSKEDDASRCQKGLDNLLARGLLISDIVLEKGTHRPHIHAVLTSSKKSVYAKQYQQKGLYVGIKPLKSAAAYKEYLKKEKEVPYMFSDSE